MDCNVTFIILHYITLEDTIECIKSIVNNINYNNYKIIVVDNGSPNRSGEKLKEIYKDTSNVMVIINEENLGFAKGNNIGFKIAKYDMNSDFIIMINNDTLLNQNDFIEALIEKYKRNEFAILGPDIISTIDGNHQNPQKIVTNMLLLKNIKSFLIYFLLLIMSYINLDEKILDYRNKYKKINQFEGENDLSHKNDMINVQLQGSCLIFSPIYIREFDGLYDKTFLYLEEDILFYIAQKHKMRTLYSPSLRIYHKEDSSTNAKFTRNKDKRKFVYKNILKSILVFQMLIIKYEIIIKKR